MIDGYSVEDAFGTARYSDMTEEQAIAKAKHLVAETGRWQYVMYRDDWAPVHTFAADETEDTV